MPVFRGLGNRLLRKTTQAFDEVGISFDNFDGDSFEIHKSLSWFLGVYDLADPRYLAKEGIRQNLEEAIAAKGGNLPLNEQVVADIANVMAAEFHVEVSAIYQDLAWYLKESKIYEPLNEIWTERWDQDWSMFVFHEWDSRMEAAEGEGVSVGFNGWVAKGDDPHAGDKGVTFYFSAKELIENTEEHTAYIQNHGLTAWWISIMPFFFGYDDVSIMEYKEYIKGDHEASILEDIERDIRAYLGTDTVEDPNQMRLFPTE
jgi:hypothetical protein